MWIIEMSMWRLKVQCKNEKQTLDFFLKIKIVKILHLFEMKPNFDIFTVSENFLTSFVLCFVIKDHLNLKNPDMINN